LGLGAVLSGMGFSCSQNRKRPLVAAFFFLTPYYQNISWGDKTCQLFWFVSGLLFVVVTLGKWWKLDEKSRVWSFGIRV
jgi:hypothetical protein